MTHDKKCQQNGFTYEIGSGQDIPDCTCKMDYKSALDDFDKHIQRFLPKRSTVYAIRAALQLAQEAERVKRERDELAARVKILETRLYGPHEFIKVDVVNGSEE